MTIAGARSWLGRRSAVEWAAIAAAVATFTYLGSDAGLWDPRTQLVLHAVGIGVVGGVAVAAWRGSLELPRTPVDLPVLALVTAFALATASAMNVGMSLRALASIVGFALMLPVALVAVRHRPSWVGAITAGAILLLAVPSLVALVARRVAWVVAGAPGLPPIRLPAEGTLFGSVAVPPFLIWPAWALAGLIEAPRWRRGVRTALVAVGIPLTILSGSRSAWLAIGITAVVAIVPLAWRRRDRLARAMRPTPGRLAIAVLGLALTVLVLVAAVPRLLAVSSLIYRVSLWRDTLAAWSTDPLLGIGPGFMPIARQAAAPDFSFPVRQPHSHNLPLGVLGDAGVVGLVAAIVLVVALVRVAGPWRSRTRVGRHAAFVLLGIGVGGLFEDLTFEPIFNLVAITLVAVVLLDAGVVRWAPLPRSGRGRPTLAVGSGVIAVVLLTAIVTGDAGAIAYRAGVDAAVAGRPAEATAWLERSSALDPWHPATPKALAITAAAGGDLEGARAASVRATEANPGDGHAWTNLALVCRELGDPACVRDAATRAVATAGFGEVDQLNAALLLDELGDAGAADEAYRRSLLGQRLTVFGPAWPRDVRVSADGLEEDVAQIVDLNLVLGRWAMDDPTRPSTVDDPAVRALAHAIEGDREAAMDALERAIDERPDALLTWEIAVVLHDHWGTGEAPRLQTIGEVVRGGPFPPRDERQRIPRRTWDLAVFRGYPRDELVEPAVRLFTVPPFPWAMEATLP